MPQRHAPQPHRRRSKPLLRDSAKASESDADSINAGWTIMCGADKRTTPLTGQFGDVNLDLERREADVARRNVVRHIDDNRVATLAVGGQDGVHFAAPRQSAGDADIRLSEANVAALGPRIRYVGGDSANGGGDIR